MVWTGGSRKTGGIAAMGPVVVEAIRVLLRQFDIVETKSGWEGGPERSNGSQTICLEAHLEAVRCPFYSPGYPRLNVLMSIRRL